MVFAPNGLDYVNDCTPRVLVHVGATQEEASRTGRDPHDEFCRFLAQYGRFSGYLGQESGNALGYQPTLEESVGQQIMAIGSVDEVVETIGMYRQPRSALR